MDDYTDVLIVFSLAVIALAVLQTGMNWILGVAMILTVMSVWLVKASITMSPEPKETTDFEVLDRLDSISYRLKDLIKELNLSAFASSQRLEDVKRDSAQELDNKYRELARKIFDVENKMNRSEKSTLFALAKLEERVNSIDELLGVFETERSKRAG